LGAYGWQINTAFIERLNLDLRQHGAASGRRVPTRWYGEDGWRQQRAFCQTSHNLWLPHARFRPPRPQALPTNGPGSTLPWRSCPPALAARLPEHGWSRREVLLDRVPPWPHPAGA
jgi:hypothetical protein